MQATFLSGDPSRVEQRRRELVGGRVSETVDVADDGGAGLLRAVTSPDLFGGVRVVVANNVSDLDVSVARALAADTGSAVVVATSDKVVPAPVKRALRGAAAFEHFRAKPSAADVVAAAGGVGVEFSGRTADAVFAAVDGDVCRARWVAWQCSVLGWDRPSYDQVLALVCPSGEEVPWALAEAVGRGDLAAAVRCAVTPAAVAIVSAEVVRAAALATAERPEAVAAQLGLNDWQYRRSRAMSQRLRRDDVAAMLGCAVELGIVSRVTSDPSRLVVAVVALAGFFASA